MFDIDLSEYLNSEELPLLLQWDERRGYIIYGSNMMGLTGCGPTCLSMVCMYLLQDATYTPRFVADFAEENGYYVEGSGSAWTLISEGGKRLGLDIVEISPEENRRKGCGVMRRFGDKLKTCGCAGCHTHSKGLEPVFLRQYKNNFFSFVNPMLWYSVNIHFGTFLLPQKKLFRIRCCVLQYLFAFAVVAL